ncbi:unnamed protein product, partial [Prorocentrum cordatum]
RGGRRGGRRGRGVAAAAVRAGRAEEISAQALKNDRLDGAGPHPRELRRAARGRPHRAAGGAPGARPRPRQRRPAALARRPGRRPRGPAAQRGHGDAAALRESRPPRAGARLRARAPAHARGRRAGRTSAPAALSWAPSAAAERVSQLEMEA